MSRNTQAENQALEQLVESTTTTKAKKLDDFFKKHERIRTQMINEGFPGIKNYWMTVKYVLRGLQTDLDFHKVLQNWVPQPPSTITELNAINKSVKYMIHRYQKSKIGFQLPQTPYQQSEIRFQITTKPFSLPKSPYRQPPSKSTSFGTMEPQSQRKRQLQLIFYAHSTPELAESHHMQTTNDGTLTTQRL